MKHRPAIFLLLSATLLALRVLAEPAPLDPSSNPRFTQSRTRIDALFHNRNTPLPPPDLHLNPFRLANEATDAATPGAPAATAAVAPDSDEGMLHQAATTMKVGGLVVRDGTPQIGINGGLYKEGDVIPARVRGTLVYLRIRHISADGVVIALNDAEMTIQARSK